MELELPNIHSDINRVARDFDAFIAIALVRYVLVSMTKAYKCHNDQNLPQSYLLLF